MSAGRPAPAVTVPAQLRRELQSMADSRSFSRTFTRRVHIVLLAAEGMNNSAIADQLGVSAHTVGFWRRRFLKKGIAGLYDEPKPGSPRSLMEDEVATLVYKALNTQPRNSRFWTVRALAAETNLSRARVHRFLRASGLQLDRQRDFNLSTDFHFAEKVLDIVGLYLNPPDLALALCIDEERHIQGLDSGEPVLIHGLGYVEGVAKYHARHGTTTLATALDIAAGQDLVKPRPSNRTGEFRDFIRQIDKDMPEELDVLVVSTSDPKFKRPRIHYQIIPNYASWLKQVEICFNIITQKAIRQGTFGSVKAFTSRIDNFVTRHEDQWQAFIWTATRESISEKQQRTFEAVVRKRRGR